MQRRSSRWSGRPALPARVGTAGFAPERQPLGSARRRAGRPALAAGRQACQPASAAGRRTCVQAGARPFARRNSHGAGRRCGSGRTRGAGGRAGTAPTRHDRARGARRSVARHGSRRAPAPVAGDRRGHQRPSANQAAHPRLPSDLGRRDSRHAGLPRGPELPQGRPLRSYAGWPARVLVQSDPQAAARDGAGPPRA